MATRLRGRTLVEYQYEVSACFCYIYIYVEYRVAYEAQNCFKNTSTYLRAAVSVSSFALFGKAGSNFAPRGLNFTLFSLILHPGSPILHFLPSILHFFHQFHTPGVQFYIFKHQFYTFPSILHPGGPILHFLMTLVPGAESLNFVNFQGPEHVKHEGFGPPGVENPMKIDEKSVYNTWFLLA